MKRDIASEVRRATASRTTDVVASRYSITRSDLVDGPLTIAQKGIYTLAGSLANVRWSETYREVILIASSNVELNLAGNEISLDPAYAGSVPPDFALVRVAPGTQGVFVKGGTLRRSPVGLSFRNVRRFQASDLEILGAFRKGVESFGASNWELVRCKVCLGPRTRSFSYEHASELIRLLHEDGRLAGNAPTTLVPELQRILNREDELRQGEPDPFEGWDHRNPPPPTEESGACAIEISVSPEGGPALSPLLDFVRGTVVACPVEFRSVLLDGEIVLRDDAGYPISWDALFEPETAKDEEACRTAKALLLAQVWIGSQTGTVPEEVVVAASGSSSELARVRERCVPTLDGDFRGVPLSPPGALTMVGAGNALVRRSEFACFNESEPDAFSEIIRELESDDVPSHFSPFLGVRRDYRDACAVRLSSGAQSCTFDGCVVSGVQSSTGWAVALSADDSVSGIILKDCRLGSILAIPTREVEKLPDDVRAVGIDLGSGVRDVQIDNLQLDQTHGEISCGSSDRGSVALVSQAPSAPGRSFSAVLGQTTLGFS
jgi:hypothetical protein